MPVKRVMPVEPKYLRAVSAGRPTKVDRGAGKIFGYTVAQLGPFKTEGRGEFDVPALESIVKLGNSAPKGLKSRFTHPDMSSDGLGKFLGRSTDFSMSQAVNADGERVKAVRADLTFDKSAFDTPSGNLADYVMTLAESDPEALSSSLVLAADEELRLNKDGTAQADKEGNPLPPLWRPTKLVASDIVDTGDAVDGLLAARLDANGLPLSDLWNGAAMLDRVFDGQPRSVVEARVKAYLRRYCDRKFGPRPSGTPLLSARRLGLGEMAATLRRVNARLQMPDESGSPFDIQVGDCVEFLVEDPDELCACLEDGVVEAISPTGLMIPGTSLSLKGTASDPAVRVCDNDDEDGPCWYLVPMSRLRKGDDEGGGPETYGNAIITEDSMFGGRPGEALGANLSHDSKTNDGEPSWGSVDKTKLPRVAFAEKGDAGKKSTWGYPHHYVTGGAVDPGTGVYTSGTLWLHKGGLNAAWSAAQGGRSGQKASSAVIAHLQAHRRALGLED